MVKKEAFGTGSLMPGATTERKINMEGIIRSIEQRNQLVEQYLWCIDAVIHQNYALIVAAHLDWQDVYQALAERLIRAIGRYDPAKGRSMKGYICDQLKFELLSCGSARAQYGFTKAPYYLRNTVVSMEELAEQDPYWEYALVA